MHTSSIEASPVNHRGGQSSYLLLAKGQFGSRHLSVTWVDCPPGSQQPIHAHDGQEQAYVITRGQGTMIVGNEEQRVEAGMLVFVPPGSGHAIRNDGSEPLTFVSATAPPFDPARLDPALAYTTPATG
jgi:mannose-6-phosphate isomerase-like protein (cupin superfamily)